LENVMLGGHLRVNVNNRIERGVGKKPTSKVVDAARQM
jgi:hypothetical protein